MGDFKIKKWNIIDHLKTEEDMANYLEACFEEEDPELIVAAISDIALARGIPQTAHEVGLSTECLSKALYEGNLEFVTVMNVIKLMGFKLHAQR
ncbi:MAG: putative addiction module antidote protein [Desulfobacterales bacterium]|nr:putative addiction module antidote protein [Desulfobacterales bacterium]